MMNFFSTLFSSRSRSNSKDAAKSRLRTKENAKDRGKPQGVFIKTGVANSNAQKVLDVASLSAVQKTHLVKKGNVFLEEGNIPMAHKIFRALQVYDGLMRVSKAYYVQGRMTAAHGAAREAWTNQDVSQMTGSISGALRVWLMPNGLNAYATPSKESRLKVLSAYQNRRSSNA